MSLNFCMQSENRKWDKLFKMNQRKFVESKLRILWDSETENSGTEKLRI